MLTTRIGVPASWSPSHIRAAVGEFIAKALRNPLPPDARADARLVFLRTQREFREAFSGIIEQVGDVA